VGSQAVNVRNPSPPLLDRLKRMMKRLMRRFEEEQGRRPFSAEAAAMFIAELRALPAATLRQIYEPTDLALAGLLFHRGQEDFGWLTRPAHDLDDRVVLLPLTVRVPDSTGNLVELPERVVPRALLCRELDWCHRRRAWLRAELERQNAEHEARTARLRAELAEVDQRIAGLEAEIPAGGVAAD
jgi:hypothetical protein